MDGPAFYCYTIPRPVGIEEAPVRPQEAKWNPQLSEFILMYDDVRKAESPEEALLEFLESTYDAGARLAGWGPRRASGSLRLGSQNACV